jgi:hypothetical protein
VTGATGPAISSAYTSFVAARTTSTGAIANTETVIVSYTILANSLAAGDSFLLKGIYTRAGTNATQATLRVRVGTTTLTGNIAATLTMPFAATAVPGYVEMIVTCRTTGAGGTIGGGGFNLHNVTSGVNVSDLAGTVAVNTTVQNLIELTIISGNASNSYNFSFAVIEFMQI